MKENITIKKVFLKSSNSIKNINNVYTYSLLIYLVLISISYLLTKNTNLLINLYKSLVITTITGSVLSYIINIVKKNYNILNIYTKDYTHIITIIISIILYNYNIIYQVIATIISIIIKYIYPKLDKSSTVFGILPILIYNYITNNPEYIITNLTIIDYLNIIIPIISFIYLFHHKSIKYNIVISYLITYITILLIYVLFNNVSIHLLLSSLSRYSLIFIVIYILPDYRVTPTINKGCIIYGIILAIISSILYLIIPSISLTISIIIGELLLTNLLEKISPKLKYNYKFYYLIIMICTIITIIIFTLLKVKI